MKEKVFDTAKGRIHYWISTEKDDGAGKDDRQCLVMLHGLTADHTLFDKQVEQLEGSFRLIVWDAPAHGLSRPYNGFSYPDCAEALLGILDAEGEEAPVLVGQSMGGYVIQSFLARHPERASGFVSIDSAPYGEDYYSASDRWWLRQMEWMCRCYPLKLLKSAVANSVGVTEYARRNMAAMLEPYGKRELCHLTGMGYLAFLEDNRDMEIHCPTVLIAGEKDRTGKVLQYCRMWHERTGFPLHIIPNAAHNSNADAPDAVDRVIVEFAGQLVCRGRQMG